MSSDPRNLGGNRAGRAYKRTTVDTTTRQAICCACSSHIEHSLCNEHCECFGGEFRREFGIYEGRRGVDVITRIWIDPEEATDA